MHLRMEAGIVASVVRSAPTGRELLVEVNRTLERAWQEPAFGVWAEVGDRVLLNTTAVRLGLGTGGVHFVLAVQRDFDGEGAGDQMPGGHIVKLRYTPWQRAVWAVEEQGHPAHERMREADSLEGMPVVICELHSMLPAVAMTVQYQSVRPARLLRVVYVMTDGGALPMGFSRTVQQMKELGLLAGTVTVGHAYGGDLEAVNLYSGLLAARHVLGADVAVVAMGPGIVGTGTKFGHTGIEVGQAVNAVASLEGEAVVVPRISFADRRERHRGVSHHTLTALTRVALAPATVTMPRLAEEETQWVRKQLIEAGVEQRHRVEWLDGSSLLDAAAAFPLPLRTMGRSPEQDPAFFLAAGAAGEWVANRMKKPPGGQPRRTGVPLFTERNC
jgi:hypothetical protein